MENIKSAVALDWDHNSNSIFWTDVEKDTINRAYLNGSQQTIIVGSNLSKRESLKQNLQIELYTFLNTIYKSVILIKLKFIELVFLFIFFIICSITSWTCL